MSFLFQAKPSTAEDDDDSEMLRVSMSSIDSTGHFENSFSETGEGELSSLLVQVNVDHIDHSGLPLFETDDANTRTKEEDSPPMGCRGRSVSFSTVEVHSHSMILGDNPAVSQGLPVALDDKAIQTSVYTVDEHENISPQRRTKHELRLTNKQRHQLLALRGYSPETFQRAYEEVEAIKRSRMESLQENFDQQLQQHVEEFREHEKPVRQPFRWLGRRDSPERDECSSNEPMSPPRRSRGLLRGNTSIGRLFNTAKNVSAAAHRPVDSTSMNGTKKIRPPPSTLKGYDQSSEASSTARTSVDDETVSHTAENSAVSEKYGRKAPRRRSIMFSQWQQKPHRQEHATEESERENQKQRPARRHSIMHLGRRRVEV